ncbi:MAG: H/ACA ribonucleoprotein complex subunit GAR1 [Haloferacaceae archaeon]
MRRLGTAVRAAGGVAVVRAPAGEDPPDLGTTVVDEDLTTVGRVVDVFGPVSRPFLAVSPAEGVDPATLLGDRLYAR